MSIQDTEETTPLSGIKAPTKATQCSRIQAPIQCFLRPAMWIPGLNRLHSVTQTWHSADYNVQKNIECVERALAKVIDKDTTHSDFIVNKVEPDFLQILVFTRAEWLDVIEMEFKDNVIKIWAFSSGFLPLFLPGAFLLNLAFFWVPFMDMGMNKTRLKWIFSQLDIPMQHC